MKNLTTVKNIREGRINISERQKDAAIFHITKAKPTTDTNVYRRYAYLKPRGHEPKYEKFQVSLCAAVREYFLSDLGGEIEDNEGEKVRYGLGLLYFCVS